MTHSWLTLLHEIADGADSLSMRWFGVEGLRVDDKHDGSPVSEADRVIEAMARSVAQRSVPGIGVCGEEGGEAPARDGVRLIVDPIDGTRNFVRAIPIFATLLAIEEDGAVVAGVVSAPALGARWHAARGAGAFAGKRRLRVSRVDSLARAHLFHGDLSGNAESGPPRAMRSLIGRVARSRGFGDFYQHVLVAEGAGEAAVDPAVKAWDVAALQVIVEEAGGRATTFAGKRSIYGGSLLSTNGLVHEAMVDALGRGENEGKDENNR